MTDELGSVGVAKATGQLKSMVKASSESLQQVSQTSCQEIAELEHVHGEISRAMEMMHEIRQQLESQEKNIESLIS